MNFLVGPLASVLLQKERRNSLKKSFRKLLILDETRLSLVISLNFSVPSFGASEALRNWHGKNHKWLELSDVHRETTESIRVTVIPFFMGSRVSKAHMFQQSLLNGFKLISSFTF